jgi:hypothetical protein
MAQLNITFFGTHLRKQAAAAAATSQQGSVNRPLVIEEMEGWWRWR